MKFKYIATQPDGKIVEGEMVAQASGEVAQILAGRSLKPVSVKAVSTIDFSGVKFFGQKVTISDKVFLTRYLSLMLRAGTDLFRAIDILINDLDKPVLKALLTEIKNNLEKGNPFYITFAKYPNFFSSVFVNLVKAGEASGNLTAVLDNLSVSLEKERELKSKIKSALIYPIILLVMSLLMLLLLVTFALPKIANVFLSTGVQPPLFSRIVFGIGLFLSKNALIIFPLGGIAVVGVAYFLLAVPVGKKLLSLLASHLPLISTVIDQLALQRFAATLASLLRAGMPIIDSLEITADAVGSEKFKSSLRHIAREGIAKGLTIGDAFRREAVFPLVVINLISVSEKAGHLDEILKTLSGFYETEVDNAVKTMVAFIEPIMLLFIGVLIGSIALAVVVPIYQLVGGI
ncbi:MAG: type II secretion system F family protein [Candidatus Harrisonbacteria bacterium]|nr:type II secretion system F family protein [Candidatus Harrisonbacteria bacterium]